MIKKAWNCELVECAQSSADDSFIGGIPKLPAGTEIPICTLSGHKMTFMFQIAFPQGHVWENKTMALFACLDCYSSDYCIPEMPPGNTLHNVEIPDGFLDAYQRNFRVLVFDTKDGVPLDGYVQRIPFRRMDMKYEMKTNRDADFTLAGRPIWIMGQNETPGKYAGTQDLKLLFQIREEFRFPRIEDAPLQADRFCPNGLLDAPYYFLFVCNRIYFWGTLPPNEPKVYISVQTP